MAPFLMRKGAYESLLLRSMRVARRVEEALLDCVRKAAFVQSQCEK